MGLDDLIENETDAVTTKVTRYGRDLINVKNEFNDKIKSLNGDYAKANAEFADDERIRKSFQMGQKYQQLDTKEAVANIKKMNADEKEAFRLGMMADINKRVDRFKSGDFTREVFKSNNQKLLIRNAFSDTLDANGNVIKSAQDAYTDFSQYIKGLEQQSKTAKKIIGGSPSGERLSTQAEAGELGSITQSLTSGSLTGTALGLLKTGLARSRGISGETSEALQKKLFSVDPIEQRAVLDELNRRARKKPTGLLSGAAALGTATGILGD
jgi:ribulose bisphosphate carboxylase small subunit